MRLVLFMTRGMSLAAWNKNGSLSRELALYKKMATHGVTTSIISWGGREDKLIADQFPWLNVHVNFFNLPALKYERFLPIIHAKPLILADVIKSNQTNGADIALRCANFWCKPFVARCGYAWSFCVGKENPDKLNRVLQIERDVFRAADISLVTSQAAGAYLAATHGISSTSFICIPNYVPDAFFDASLPDYRDSSRAIITQVSRLAPEKNLFNLVEACVGLDVCLRLVGDGPEKAALRSHAERCGVVVEFFERVQHNDLPAFLAESTVCTLVSEYEGHPKALIEYMARGCAVLATSVPGNKGVVEHMKSGLMCGTSAKSIRDGLKALLEDVHLRETLGKNAREAARKYSLAGLEKMELQQYSRLPRSSLKRSLVSAAKKLVRRFKNHQEKISAQPSQKENLFCESILESINKYIKGVSHCEGLRTLFAIEQAMYPLQGKLSVSYDGGVHTKHRHTKYHDFFTDRIGNGEKVLDIGCGIGFLAYDIAQRSNAFVTGIELSEENIAIARKRFVHPNVEYVQGNALTDIKRGVYDTVVLSNVLEHLPGRVSFLTDVRNRLKPKRFLFRVPLFERDWRVPLKKELGLDWRLDPTHETEYTYEGFACELARAGLSITYKEFRWGEIWCEASDAIPYAEEVPAHPLITVLMATYNDEAYVGEAIASILRQTEQRFIFLIIDDASTDTTAKLLQEFAQRDARIQILKNDFRSGLTASLNRGLDKIETPYIARMDADDISLPERFERQLAYMKTHPEIAAAGSRILLGGAGGDNDEPITWNVPTSPAQIREQTISMAPQISHPAAIIRTEALKAVGGYREGFKTTQDYDLWLRLLELFDLGNAPETLLFYRSHLNAVSQTLVLEQSINHVLAMQSSECRREGKADPLCGRELDINLLVSLLDYSRPSFWAWIRLLARRPIQDKANLLLKALRLVPRLDLAPILDYMLPEDWKSVLAVLTDSAVVASEPRYAEICRQARLFAE